MLSDAFGTKVTWIHQMIIDIMNPQNNYANAYKDRFLGTMYRIVRPEIFVKGDRVISPAISAKNTPNSGKNDAVTLYITRF